MDIQIFQIIISAISPLIYILFTWWLTSRPQQKKTENDLKREFIEETGIKVEPIMPIHCETNFFNPNYTDKYKGQFWNCSMIYYIVKKISGKLTTKNFCDTEKKEVI